MDKLSSDAINLIAPYANGHNYYLSPKFVKHTHTHTHAQRRTTKKIAFSLIRLHVTGMFCSVVLPFMKSVHAKSIECVALLSSSTYQFADARDFSRVFSLSPDLVMNGSKDGNVTWRAGMNVNSDNDY